MCGRVGQSASGDHLKEYFRGSALPEIEPRYNVAPTQKLLAISGSASRGWNAGLVRWGLLPYWAETLDDAQKRSVINARAETALQKPMFARAGRSGRVVVPVSFFWEWMRTEDGRRQPILLRRRDHDLLLLAGLVDTWRSPDGRDSLSSLAILTTAPSPDIAHIHNRMPAVLTDSDVELWLDSNVSAPDAWRLLKPAEPGLLSTARANPLVNNVRNEGPELLEALSA